MRRLAFLALTLATGCSDALEQKSSAGQVIGVVNANDRTLSVISATDFTVTTRSWQMGSATPRTIDGRGCSWSHSGRLTRSGSIYSLRVRQAP